MGHWDIMVKWLMLAYRSSLKHRPKICIRDLSETLIWLFVARVQAAGRSHARYKVGIIVNIFLKNVELVQDRSTDEITYRQNFTNKIPFDSITGMGKMSQ